MARTSRADIFQHDVRYNVRKHMVYVILPLWSKRAMLCIDLHGRLRSFVVENPAGAQKARYVFAYHTMNIH
jgi:hypothetical protein